MSETAPPGDPKRGRRILIVLVAAGLLLTALVAGWHYLGANAAQLLAESERELQVAMLNSAAPEFPDRLRSAEQFARACLEQGGDERTTAQCVLSSSLLLQGRQSDARQLLNQIDPRGASTSSLASLAECLAAVRDFDSAQRILELGLERPDAGSNVFRVATQVASEMGRDDDALLAARRWTETEPTSAAPWKARAVIHTNRAEGALALAAFSESEARGGLFSPVERLEWVKLLIAAGNVADARRQWEALPHQPREGLEADRKVAESRILLFEQRPQQALEAAQRAAEADSHHVEAHLQLGRLQLLLARPADAERSLAEAVQLQPANLEALHLLAQAKLAQNKPDAAAILERSRSLREMGIEVHRLEQEAAQRPKDDKVRRKIAALYEQAGLTRQAEFWRSAAGAIQAPRSSPP